MDWPSAQKSLMVRTPFALVPDWTVTPPTVTGLLIDISGESDLSRINGLSGGPPVDALAGGELLLHLQP